MKLAVHRPYEFTCSSCGGRFRSSYPQQRYCTPLVGGECRDKKARLVRPAGWDADAIGSLRVRMGMRQSDFAALIGISREHLSRAENGRARLRHIPALNKLEALRQSSHHDAEGRHQR